MSPCVLLHSTVVHPLCTLSRLGDDPPPLHPYHSSYILSCDCSPSGFRAIITTSSFGNNFSLSLFTHTCSLPIDSVFFRLLCFLPFLLYGKSILGSRRPSDFCCIPRPHPLTCPASPSLVSHLPSASSSFPFSPAAPPLLH